MERIYSAKVLRIIDGDTFDVEIDVGFRMTARMPLRLAHVDAPEHNTPEGRAAIGYVTTLLGVLPSDVVVRTFKPIDKYGRYLADVLLGDASLGDLMVRDGMAVPYEGGTR